MSSKITLFAGAGFSIAVSKAVRDRVVKYESEPMPSAFQMLNNDCAKSYLENQYIRLRMYLEKYFGNKYKNESYEKVYTDILNKIPFADSVEKQDINIKVYYLKEKVLNGY